MRVIIDMKKIKTLSIILIILLFLTTPINVSLAQTPDYVGISEDDEYIWEVKFQSAPIEDFLFDISNSIDDLDSFILDLDLLGFEDLTIAESMKYLLKLNETILPGFTPSGWESSNISTMIKMIIEGLNTTIAPGGIPNNWESLNISTIAENVLDAAMPIGWEDYTILDTIEFIVNELNSAFFSNIIPSGWEDITIKDLFDIAIEGFNSTIFPGLIPEGWENLKLPILLENLIPIIPHELMNQLFMLLFPEDGTDFTISSLMEQLFQTPYWDQITIHDLLGMLINATILPNFEEYNLSFFFDNIIYSLNESGLASLNMSDFIDYIVISINNTIPLGLFSEDFINLDMSTLIDEGIDVLIDLVNGSGLGEVMPLNWQSFNMDELLDFGVSQLISMLNISIPISSIIPGWEDLTITELIQYVFDTYIVPMVDQYILLIDEQLDVLKQTGFFEYTYGIKLTVENIGSESTLYPNGPSAVPIQITLEYSLDMEIWIDLIPMIESALSSLGIIWSPVIYNPNTFPNYVKAFTEQAFSTGLLVIATNYDWAVIDTVTSYELPFDLEIVGIDFKWDKKGVLLSGAIEYGNQAIFSIHLKGEKAEEVISGYEIPFLIGISTICAITIIFYIRKKKEIFL
jgi:hypothetical protein